MLAHWSAQSSLFDGNSTGEYCVSEQDVNRQLLFSSMVPTGRDESSSDEEEEDDLSSQFLEYEPHWPYLLYTSPSA